MKEPHERDQLTLLFMGVILLSLPVVGLASRYAMPGWLLVLLLVAGMGSLVAAKLMPDVAWVQRLVPKLTPLTIPIDIVLLTLLCAITGGWASDFRWYYLLLAIALAVQGWTFYATAGIGAIIVAYLLLYPFTPFQATYDMLITVVVLMVTGIGVGLLTRRRIEEGARVTRQEAMEHRYEDFYQNFRALTEILQPSVDMPNLLKSIVEVFSRTTEARYGTVLLYEADSRRLKIRATSGFPSDYAREVNENHPISLDDTPDAPAAIAFRDKRIALTTDTETDPGFDHWRQVARVFGYRSLACVPIGGNGLPEGVMCLYWPQPREFEEFELEFLNIAGYQFASCLANARSIEQEVKRKTEELNRAHRQAQEKSARLEEANLTLTQTISELRRLEHERADFLNVVSHDLRIPLTAILGYLELLDDETAGPLTPVQHSFIDKAVDSVQRMTRLLEDLLDFARMESGHFRLARETLDYPDLVMNVSEGMRSLAEQKALHMIVDAPGDPVKVWADPDRVAQVLGNLISNAIKYTPEGEIRVTVCPKAPWVVTEVKDTGLGIPPEAMPRLFNRFFRVRSPETQAIPGVGLGLAITKALVEAMGGQIGVQSTVGEGSTFWFTLPMEPPSTAGAARP